MEVGILLVSLYLGYFLFDYLKEKNIDRKIRKYDEAHIDEEIEEPIIIDRDKILSRKEWYHTVYLQSDHWKKTRKTALQRADYKCQLCGRRNLKLNVHHNNYENLEHEHMSDLIVLCDDCHTIHHKYNEKIS